MSGKGKGAVMKCPECESILPFVFAYATAEKKQACPACKSNLVPTEKSMTEIKLGPVLSVFLRRYPWVHSQYSCGLMNSPGLHCIFWCLEVVLLSLQLVFIPDSASDFARHGWLLPPDHKPQTSFPSI